MDVLFCCQRLNRCCMQLTAWHCLRYRERRNVFSLFASAGTALLTQGAKVCAAVGVWKRTIIKLSVYMFVGIIAQSNFRHKRTLRCGL